MKCIIMAAGIGSRMKRLNNTPKVFQTINNTPIIEIEIRKLIEVGFQEKDITIVLSKKTSEYAKHNLVYKKVNIVIQSIPDGTGGAIKACTTILDDDDGWVLIMNGDSPLFSVKTIKDIISRTDPTLTISVLDDPKGYGRVILNDKGMIVDIIEENDCDDENAKIKTVNTSIFWANCKKLKFALSKLDNNNTKKEYLLTHITRYYNFYPYNLEHTIEGFNINTPEQLKEARYIINKIPAPINKHIQVNKNNKRVIVISDVHGCFYTMIKLLTEITYNKDEDLLIFVGDIINKGPNSKEVVDWLMNSNALCIRGNNEDRELQRIDMLKKKHSLQDKHVSYIINMPYTISIVDIGVLIVHGGIVPGKSINDQKPFDMISMRNITVDNFGRLRSSHRHDIGKPWYTYLTNYPFVIYGHDATRGLTLSKYSSGLDTGCCYNKQLTACIINKNIRSQVKDSDLLYVSIKNIS
jgi:choline kinase/predicted phosphodiesterase